MAVRAAAAAAVIFPWGTASCRFAVVQMQISRPHWQVVPSRWCSVPSFLITEQFSMLRISLCLEHL
jgi:hypothetical protein